MSKYSIAKQHVAAALQAAEGEPFDGSEVIEAIIVTAVQELIRARGGNHTREVLRCELDNVSSDGVFDIQKR